MTVKVPLTTRLQAAKCPHCGTVLDAASAFEERARPSRGDLGVCVRCAELLVYDVDLMPRLPKPNEIERMFAAEPGFAATVRRHQRAILRMHDLGAG